MDDVYGFPLVVKGLEIHSAHKSRVLTCDECMSADEICTILNAHFAKKDDPAKDTPPTPNQAETDRVAMEFYKSGRTITVEHWNEDAKLWVWSGGQPSFFPTLAYRIKPKKRRVVVEIYENPIGKLYAHIPDQGAMVFPLYRFIGTIEGEVEV